MKPMKVCAAMVTLLILACAPPESGSRATPDSLGSQPTSSDEETFSDGFESGDTSVWQASPEEEEEEEEEPIESGEIVEDQDLDKDARGVH